MFSQQHDLRVEVVIHDDASTDKTQKLVKEIARSNSKKNFTSRLIFQNTNQFMNGMGFLPDLISECKGTYISIIEGDDYWTDYEKILKQFKFLEQNRDYAICATAYLSGKDQETAVRYPNLDTPKIIEISRETFSKSNEIGTLTVMFRKKMLPQLPQDYNLQKIGDYPLWGLLSSFGKIGLINEVTAFYRLHEDNYFAQKPQDFKFFATLAARQFVAGRVTGENQSIWIDGLCNSIKEFYFQNKELLIEIERLKSCEKDFESRISQLEQDIVKLTQANEHLIEDRKKLKDFIEFNDFKFGSLGLKMNLNLTIKLFKSLLTDLFHILLKYSKKP